MPPNGRMIRSIPKSSLRIPIRYFPTLLSTRLATECSGGLRPDLSKLTSIHSSVYSQETFDEGAHRDGRDHEKKFLWHSIGRRGDSNDWSSDGAESNACSGSRDGRKGRRLWQRRRHGSETGYLQAARRDRK